MLLMFVRERVSLVAAAWWAVVLLSLLSRGLGREFLVRRMLMSNAV
jgi:hypothetical protein